MIDEEFWTDLFSTLATECGYTPEQIREMTLHDVDRIFKGWTKFPPLRVLVGGIGAALGIDYRQTKSENSNYMTAEQWGAFVRMTGGRVPGIGQNG